MMIYTLFRGPIDLPCPWRQFQLRCMMLDGNGALYAIDGQHEGICVL